jgi:hypothetical protein
MNDEHTQTPVESWDENKTLYDLAWAAAWAISPPSGCDNCWGDLHVGCSDECRADSRRFTEWRDKIVEALRPKLQKVRLSAIRERSIELLKEVERVGNPILLNGKSMSIDKKYLLALKHVGRFLRDTDNETQL